MQVFDSFPYLTIPREKVELHAWELQGGKPLGPWLEGWDPGSDVSLSSTIALDPLEVRKICGLGKSSKLSIVVTWRSSGTTLRGNGCQIAIPVTRSGKHEFRLTLTVPGQELAGRLDLRTAVVLNHPGQEPRDALSARHPGSILWIRQDVTDLEGGRPMFPICGIPFSQFRGWSPEALWVLEWEPSTVDLYSQFSAEAKLYLNSDHPAYQAFSNSGRRAGPVGEAVRSALMHDLAETLVVAALARSEELDGEEFPGGTVGRVLAHIVSTTFDGLVASQVARKRLANPGWFTTRLQASTQLFNSLRKS